MRGRRAAPAADRPPDGLPGPARRPQPVDDDRGGRRPPAGDPQDRLGPELSRRVAEALERVGLAPVERFLTKYPSDLSGGQKQRAVIARAIILEPGGAGRRRAGLDARHERAGQDPPADARPQAGPGADLRLHHPRPGLGEVLLRPHRDHVPRPDRRDRADRRDLRQPAAPLHQGAAQGDPRARPRPAGPARPAARRDPRRGRAAAGLLVPPAVPRGGRRVRLGVARPPGAAGGALDPQGRGVRRREGRRSAISTHLDQPSTTATLGKGGAGEVRALLDRIRSENPDEPLWSGVTDIEPAGNARRGAVPAGRLAGPAPRRRRRGRLRALPRGAGFADRWSSFR